MSSPKVHVNDSIRVVNNTSWLIGGKLLLSRQESASSDHPSWGDSEGGYFVLSDAPQLPPVSQPHPADAVDLPRVYAAGDQSAVWRAGEAFIKARDIRFPQATREHVTLDFLHGKESLGFDIPTVHYHGEWNDRYYLVVSRVPGVTLSEAWPTMDQELRGYYVQRVAEICRDLAEWKGQEGGSVNGVDGGQVMELYLANDKNLDPEDLLANCAKMGMDTSSLVFYHCDLGPGNILVVPETRGIGIIDWETAGYLPREWVRTKFHMSSGMDFPTVGEGYEKTDWRRFVARKLDQLGFPEVIDGWLAVESKS